MDTPQLGTDIVFLCQNWVSAAAGPGDSGSPVFNRVDPGQVKLFGILWGVNDAGEFVYSPIANIKWELGALQVY